MINLKKRLWCDGVGDKIDAVISRRKMVATAVVVTVSSLLAHLLVGHHCDGGGVNIDVVVAQGKMVAMVGSGGNCVDGGGGDVQKVEME